jgi:hypothetical protein
VVTRLSCRQAARLTWVRREFIALVNKSEPATIEALAKGEISLRDLRHAAETTAKTDRVGKYIERVGRDAVLEAFAKSCRGQPDVVAGCLVPLFGPAVMVGFSIN